MTKINLKSQTAPRTLDIAQLKALIDCQTSLYRRTGILMTIGIMDMGFRFSFSKTLVNGGHRLNWNHIVSWLDLEHCVLSVEDLVDRVITEAESRIEHAEKEHKNVAGQSNVTMASPVSAPDVPVWQRGIRGEC